MLSELSGTESFRQLQLEIIQKIGHHFMLFKAYSHPKASILRRPDKPLYFFNVSRYPLSGVHSGGYAGLFEATCADQQITGKVDNMTGTVVQWL